MVKLVPPLRLPALSLNMQNQLAALIAVFHALNKLDSLDGKSPWHLHALRNMFLILLSLLFLPLTTFILVATYILQPLCSTHTTGRRARIRSSPSFRPRKILVTGVSMAKGLILARAFHLAGHDVIGADYEVWSVPLPGRASRSLKKFYTLPKPSEKEGPARYLAELVRIAKEERVELWVSCSAHSCAVEDGQAKMVLEQRLGVVAIQFDVETTRILQDRNLFLPYTKDLGLPIPETHTVTSRAEVHRLLSQGAASTQKGRKKQYLLKPVALGNLTRMDPTPLPRRTMSQTYHQVAKTPISASNPWLLQRFVRGKEYCTHALVVRGIIKSFVACPSSDLVMHYESIARDSPLNKSMFLFTKEFVARASLGGGKMTGHLSFDFLVDEIPTEKGVEIVLQPIECNPITHTAITVAFQGREHEMVDAYLSALEQTHLINTNGSPNPPSSSSRLESDPSDSNGILSSILTPTHVSRSYWIGHDIFTLLLIPLLHVFSPKFSLSTYLGGYVTLLTHILTWKEATFEFWDPLPSWWLYHVYWPKVWWAYTVNKTKWKKINVSTGRYFAC